MAHILIIDDEKSIRHSLKEILEYESYKVDEAPDGIEGIKMAEKTKYDLIFCDIKMPKMDGIEVLENLQSKCPEVPVVMISGHGNIDTAVEAIKKGAFDFIAKPLDLNRILITVRNAMDRTVLVKETKTLRRKITRTNDMIGDSQGIKHVKEIIERVAPTDARVMITGSNGTGKELVARWIHEKSNRREMPLIEVNCAAIPSELIESELFGHEKGAFTSAIKTRSGKFEQANGGTIFLDEIGDMSLSAQAKVLRALQENRITRVGGEKDFAVDVRILAATNKDLKKEIEKGNFREDLYHRLSVILIHVPSLDERKEDIPHLVRYFLKEVADEYKNPVKEISDEAIKELQNKSWTGNIRELRNVVERLVILGEKVISKNDVINFVAMPK
ncbi:MAG TPA: sigma-54 dependent transcriptional regulator [Bacteroidia bacterium]|nr:MAG: putative two component, sigma54 specific, transcriptional regulator, Fis family protein [Bacteroidetes bacterium OLB10]MBE7510626.1 sigma-54-dependent Fis family transcriptional regulator [Bacteroidia bacterium]MBX3106110.1 sigma-54-dependent Fis family transcriptional regulator [Bacteroidota bacterium]MCE7955935.1 sigma-54-dependent Fis family transcriptional regulator [Bacteroidetes bacterium CHB6]OQB62695.1 MAG: Transcriptional regulatory protein ZraR [Bacteroidetes bacterium ADurb.B